MEDLARVASVCSEITVILGALGAGDLVSKLETIGIKL